MITHCSFCNKKLFSLKDQEISPLLYDYIPSIITSKVTKYLTFSERVYYNTYYCNECYSIYIYEHQKNLVKKIVFIDNYKISFNYNLNRTTINDLVNKKNLSIENFTLPPLLGYGALKNKINTVLTFQ